MTRILPRLKNGPTVAALSFVAALVTNCGEPPAPSFTENVYRPGPSSQNAERLSADAVVYAKKRAEIGQEEVDAEQRQKEIQEQDSRDISDQFAAQAQTNTHSNSSHTANSGNAASPSAASGYGSGTGSASSTGAGQSKDSSVDDSSAGSESAPSWAKNPAGSTTASSGAQNSNTDVAADFGQNSSSTASSGTGSGSTASSGTGSGSTGSSSAGSSGSGSPGTGTSDQTATNGNNAGSSSGGDQVTPIPPKAVMITQSLIQPPQRPVDLLWIVDTSGSMEEEQKYLASNFQSFITAIKNSGVNFQTALTSADVCDPSGAFNKLCPVDYGGSAKTHLQGSFVGTKGRKVLKDSDDDLISKFTSYANMGISGSGFEHGLTAAAMAVAKSLSGVNESLVRADAFLSIIVVSDEEDDGIGMSKPDENGYNFAELGLSSHRYSHDDFITEMNKIKGPGNFAVTAITGTRDANGKLCTSPHSKPYEEGSQYINAAKATGGLVQSICETNWSKSLTNIGQDLTAQISQISLEKMPDLSSINVEINGVKIQDWQYITATNSIKFAAHSIPPPGASITVSYLSTP